MLDADDLVSVVKSDLRHIHKEWATGADDDALRRGSPMLRRLLVDGELQRAWRAAGMPKQPQIKAVCLDHALQGVQLKDVVFASAGGALHDGMALAGALMRDIAVPQEELKARHARGPNHRTFKLLDFVEAPCVCVRDHKVSRRTVIKYVTNKLGGAHHDAKRGNDKEELSFILLDKFGKRQVQFAGKPLIYFELLAIAQAVVDSDDIKKFAGIDAGGECGAL